MLQFVLGSAGTGKSAELQRRVEQAAREGKRVFFFVPEQFTFETERNYFSQLGPKVFRNISVLSFTRLAHRLFREFGGTAGDYADDSMKLVLMDFALHSVKEELGIYRQSVGNIQFSQNMVELVKELKNADLSVDGFAQSVERLPTGTLKRKSKDISLIFASYEALLGAGYKDEVDDLTRAGQLLKEYRYLEGCQVFIDEFKGFTARELALIRWMLRQAESVTVALCTDREDTGPNSLFFSVNETYSALKRIAQLEQQSIAAPYFCREQHRFCCPELSHLERNVFRSRVSRYAGVCGRIQAVLAANEYDEVDYVLSTIRELVEREGYRYRDIVLITRDLPAYQSCLETAFSKYQVPYYLDARKSIASHPLIRFVEQALECVSSGLTSESILSMLKCGVTPFSDTDLASLENYAYLWNLKRKQWEEPFSLSIFGMNSPKVEEQQNQQDEMLALLNQIRSRTITALEKLKKGVRREHALDIGQALLVFLEDMSVRETLEQLIGQTQELDIQQEYRKVWEILGQILEILTRACGDRPLPVQRYWELFCLVASHFDMGAIPQTLDSVTVGSAERIRTDCPKVVFVLGANDRVFPYVPEGGGIYTDAERGRLLELGMELSKPLKDRIREEKFIAYKTLSTPSERLYLTARKADVKGSTLAPSMLFRQMERMFGEEVLLDTDDLDRLYFCRTPQTAFSVLANQFRQDTPLTATLKEYFSTQPGYAEKMAAIAGGLTQGKYRLTDLKQVRQLYGTRVVMSPTRVEQYHHCKFRYFCEQGMELKPRERVQFNAVNRGTIVHEILYRVCTQIKDFSHFDQQEVERLVGQAVEQEVERLGGYENQTERFRYLYHRMEQSVMTLLRRLFDELSHSGFQPAAFEYVIGATGHVPPFTFTSPDGITIEIQGTVDRIDYYDSPSGERYIRVIDYKTGAKEFRLSDLINGVNLQLFLYLLCLERGRAAAGQPVQSAGALYFPAGDMGTPLSREAGEEELLKAEQGHYQMKGAVLDNDQVVRAMEPDLDGVYTPISVKAKAYDRQQKLKEEVFVEHRANQELFSASSLEFLLTEPQLQTLFRSVEQTVADMVHQLYQGNIEAKPLMDSTGHRYNGCDYCAFSNICGFEEGNPVNEYLDLKKKDLFEYLAQRQEEKEEH